MAALASDLASGNVRRRVVAPGWGQPSPVTALSAPPPCSCAVAGTCRRWRALGSLAVLVLLALALQVTRPAHDGIGASREATTVVVGAGETLWEVAGPYAPENVEPHVWARRVAQANGLEPGSIRPGTQLRLPVVHRP